MRIVTYVCTDDTAPAGTEAVARIISITHYAKGGRPIEGHNPIIIYGATAEEAREKAQAWWDGEVEKERRRQANAAAAAERARARKANVEKQP